MAKIRVTHPIDPKLNHDCDLIHIESYELREVILPASGDQKARKAMAIVIRGRNFRAVAEPLEAFVGEIPVRYLRIAPDERSIEGILLEEPPARAFVDVMLGDEDHARHPTPFNPDMIQRIG
jgi:hypothetical protein